VEFPIRRTFITSQDYQTRYLNTEEGNLTRPIRTRQHAHSHRQHLSTRAATQEFLVFIRHPEPQLKRCHFEPQLKKCHVLNPYPEPQLKGYVPSHNSRNTSKPTFEISSKPCRPHTSKASKLHLCCSNIV